MANASAIAFDAIVTIGMSKSFCSLQVTCTCAYWMTLIALSLHRSRSGIQKSDHVINLLIMFTVNTNLLTTYVRIYSHQCAPLGSGKLTNPFWSPVIAFSRSLHSSR